MANMCSPLFFKVFYNLGLDKRSNSPLVEYIIK